MRGILFDLDGTIADSQPIIREVFAEVQREYRGIDEPPESYSWCCGPPLGYSFERLGWDDVEAGVAAYRAVYGQRMLDTPLFEGMAGMLERLAADGYLLALATSKLQPMAESLLRHHGVLGLFTYVRGAAPEDLTSTKAAIIREAGEALASHGATGDPLMVGDRIYDVEGAAENGWDTVMVRWGAAPEEEFATAWKVADTVAELEEIIRSA